MNAIKLKIFVERSNVFTINQDMVSSKIQLLLSEHHVHILMLERNQPLINQFIQQVLLCMQPLTAASIQPFFTPLKKLAAKEESLQKQVQFFYKEKKEKQFGIDLK